MAKRKLKHQHLLVVLTTILLTTILLRFVVFFVILFVIPFVVPFVIGILAVLGIWIVLIVINITVILFIVCMCTSTSYRNTRKRTAADRRRIDTSTFLISRFGLIDYCDSFTAVKSGGMTLASVETYAMTSLLDIMVVVVCM